MTVTLEVLRLMQTILIPCAFLVVIFLCLNLYATFPKERGAKLPPWRKWSVAAIALTGAAFVVTVLAFAFA